MKNLPTYILLDQTLREGEQQAGVRFSVTQRCAIVRLLEDFGLTLIEVGHPGISAEDEAICRQTAEAARHAAILMHARAHVGEVQAVHRAGADWVGIWASINDLAFATKFVDRSPQDVLERIRDAVLEAKRLGLKVRFTVEDASRTPWEAIEAAAQAARDAGADRISLADTTGCWQPSQCAKAVQHAIAVFGCDMEVHLHNDLGLAHANALAAIDAGAKVIDVSVLGIGERAGIVNGVELATSLHLLRGDTRFDLSLIPALVQAVSSATGYCADALRPLTGGNAFTHTSAYHVKAVRHDPQAYESVPPELVGRNRTVVPRRPPLPQTLETLYVGQPFAKGASELLHHRDGPGVRWVMLDSRVDERASFYVIQRHIGLHGTKIVPEKHVDSHAHHCDSAFLYWGDQPDGTGLTCEVEMDGQRRTVHSPASVYIPAGKEHSYHYISGRGTYTNIVLAPEYNRSLLPQAIQKNKQGVALT